MRGHNICFKEVLWEIIAKLSFFLLLIWRYAIYCIYSVDDSHTVIILSICKLKYAHAGGSSVLMEQTKECCVFSVCALSTRLPQKTVSPLSVLCHKKELNTETRQKSKLNQIT